MTVFLKLSLVTILCLAALGEGASVAEKTPAKKDVAKESQRQAPNSQRRRVLLRQGEVATTVPDEEYAVIQIGEMITQEPGGVPQRRQTCIITKKTSALARRFLTDTGGRRGKSVEGKTDLESTDAMEPSLEIIPLDLTPVTIHSTSQRRPPKRRFVERRGPNTKWFSWYEPDTSTTPYSDSFYSYYPSSFWTSPYYYTPPLLQLPPLYNYPANGVFVNAPGASAVYTDPNNCIIVGRTSDVEDFNSPTVVKSNLRRRRTKVVNRA